MDYNFKWKIERVMDGVMTLQCLKQDESGVQAGNMNLKLVSIYSVMFDV